MCRNIKTLFNFEPPATDEEIQASALQFVRKLSGFHAPSRANERAFNRAVEQVTRAARTLIDSLETEAVPKNREIERFPFTGSQENPTTRPERSAASARRRVIMITFAVYLILIMVCGYGILKLFGKLTRIDAGTVLFWTICTSMPRGSRPVRPLGYGALGIYLLAFTLLFVFVYKIPLQTVYLNFRHVGGLAGLSHGTGCEVLYFLWY